MKAVVLLADWAEAINGKLYIQGGGWSRVVPTPPGIINCALAIRFLVGWEETNVPHKVVIKLVDADGKPVVPQVPPGMGAPGLALAPIEVQSQLEVGRPTGVTIGQDLDAVVAINLIGLPLRKGRYTFLLEVNDEPIDTGATFDVL